MLIILLVPEETVMALVYITCYHTTRALFIFENIFCLPERKVITRVLLYLKLLNLYDFRACKFHLNYCSPITVFSCHMFLTGCGMFRTQDVWDVGRWGCRMFGMWDVRDVKCSRCGMFRMWDVGMWDVRDMGCSGWGMFGMWDVWNVGCLGCGMLGMWDFRNVGCSKCGMFGMWDVGCGMLIYKMPNIFRCLISTHIKIWNGHTLLYEVLYL